jgi:hypothetical protein
MYALIPITSYTRHVYAQQGAEVEVYLKPHDNVWLCRNSKGEQFPCSPAKLTYTKPGEVETEPPEITNLKIGMRAELKKGRTKFKTLVSAIQDGLINKPLPVSKELWLQTAKEILDENDSNAI